MLLKRDLPSRDRSWHQRPVFAGRIKILNDDQLTLNNQLPLKPRPRPRKLNKGWNPVFFHRRSFAKLDGFWSKTIQMLSEFLPLFLVISFCQLFTDIVSTEKMRNYMRDRKDMRGTNYAYYISCFLIFLLIKSRLGISPLLTSYLLYL